jgi:hypothetical protein
MEIFNQPLRNQLYVDTADVDEFLSSAVELSKKPNITVADVIRARQVLELERRNNLYTHNGDAFDEQMARIGVLL